MTNIHSPFNLVPRVPPPYWNTKWNFTRPLCESRRCFNLDLKLPCRKLRTNVWKFPLPCQKSSSPLLGSTITLFTGPKVLVQSLKTCECICIIKDRLFSKHTVQTDSSKTMEICVFRQIPPYGSSASTHDGTKYYSRTANCKNNNVEVQTIKWYKSFFALPSTHNSAQLREKSVKISFARDG